MLLVMILSIAVTNRQLITSAAGTLANFAESIDSRKVRDQLPKATRTIVMPRSVDLPFDVGCKSPDGCKSKVDASLV
jgi:hypothetical protein